MLVSGFIMLLVVAASCSKDGSGKGPSIDNITPSSVLTGDQIVITGKNLEESIVTIGGISMNAENNTATSLTTWVPSGASVGVQVVEVSNEKGTARGNITITGVGAPPVITSITPANVAIGATIAVNGTGLANAVVRIATKVSTISSNTPNTIAVVVPSGIALGSAAVQVITPLGDVTSTINIIP